VIEIGDYCYIANASLACSSRITIGSYVYIAGGVTITDSDFHPIPPAARMADSVALSALGDRKTAAAGRGASRGDRRRRLDRLQRHNSERGFGSGGVPLSRPEP